MSITITIYFLLNVILIFVIGKISYFLKLVDIPSKRKIHTRPTAYTGGIAISLILLFAIIWFDTFDKSMSLILSSAFLISIVGFIDDKYTLNIGGKLSLQIIPIIYLIFFENLNLHQIGNYNFFYADLGTFSIPFTLLSLLFLINAFNYFDGIDGTLGFTTISVFAILYFLTLKHNDHFLVNVLNVEIFLLSISIPIIVFLLFNFSCLNLPKLFLGDSGSLLLGFIVSFILIYFANQNFIHPILLAWSVVIFVYEFLAINTIRILKRKKIFQAGKDHLHHIFLEKTKSIFLTNLFICALNIVLFGIGYLGYLLLNELASLILFIVLFIIFFIFRNTYAKN